MRVYSPKISGDLVPALYHLAKARKIPMTRLVDGMIREALAGNEMLPQLTPDHPLGMPEPSRLQPRNAA